MKNAILTSSRAWLKTVHASTLSRLGQKVLSLILRDLIPTMALLFLVGWVCQHVASQITETKENHQKKPLALAAKH